MKLIQLILIPVFITLVLFYFRRLRSLLLDRIVVAIFGATAVVMILFPEGTAKIAHFLGVGRGADLLLYVGFTGFTFVIFLLYAKLRDLEAKISELVRSDAIKRYKSS